MQILAVLKWDLTRRNKQHTKRQRRRAIMFTLAT